jgi:hypothetical protein
MCPGGDVEEKAPNLPGSLSERIRFPPTFSIMWQPSQITEVR